MRKAMQFSVLRSNRSWILVAASVLALSSYTNQVASYPTDVNSVPWPSFARRNIAALAREGYLRGSLNNFKRSISTLAKNGQLPTFRSPYDETDKPEEDEDESHEKRNIASLARLRSYAIVKKNIQALARDGHRIGRGQNQQNNKRNIQSLARDGMIHKKNLVDDAEYYYPFYQNQVPPLSDIDGPIDYNELYDYQQSVNPDMFPPLSQVYKRFPSIPNGDENYFIDSELDNKDLEFYKRQPGGMPVHGLLRHSYALSNPRNKRYILSLPDLVDVNDINEPQSEDIENEDKRSVEDENDAHNNFEKRHIGSLARLGLLPSFRFSGGRYSRSGRARLLLPSQELYRSCEIRMDTNRSIPLTRISELGNISLVPKLTQQPIQTTPTYRRRQYLLTRTRPGESSTDR